MAWDIGLLDEVEAWFLGLCQDDPVTADRIEEAIEMLADRGPTLGRPLADTIGHSTIHNLKELRPASCGSSEIRILFVFDPRRCAVLLVAGDKNGRWSEWYEKAVPLAEQRYEDHLARLEVGDG